MKQFLTIKIILIGLVITNLDQNILNNLQAVQQQPMQRVRQPVRSIPLRLMIRNIPDLFIQADLVVVGTVQQLDPNVLDISNPIFSSPRFANGRGDLSSPRTRKIQLQFGTLKVEEVIKGDRQITHCHLGTPIITGLNSVTKNSAVQENASPNILPIQPLGYSFGVNNKTSGCFFLKYNPIYDCYFPISPGAESWTNKNSPTYKTHLAELRKMNSYLKHPVKGLNATNEKDRQLAAILLLKYYQQRPPIRSGSRLVGSSIRSTQPFRPIDAPIPANRIIRGGPNGNGGGKRSDSGTNRVSSNSLPIYTQVPIANSENQKIMQILATIPWDNSDDPSLSLQYIFQRNPFPRDNAHFSSELPNADSEVGNLILDETKVRHWLKTNPDHFQILRWRWSQFD